MYNQIALISALSVMFFVVALKYAIIPLVRKLHKFTCEKYTQVKLFTLAILDLRLVSNRYLVQLEQENYTLRHNGWLASVKVEPQYVGDLDLTSRSRRGKLRTGDPVPVYQYTFDSVGSDTPQKDRWVQTYNGDWYRYNPAEIALDND